MNSDDDDSDNNPGDGQCRTGQLIISGGSFFQECTLRAALEESNSLAGSDTIEFSGVLEKIAGVVEIYPASQLPIIFDTVLIDGYSHPDYNGTVSSPIPIINLVGTNAGANASGLALVQGADFSTIQGLAISRFDHDGIILSPLFASAGPTNVRIDGNHIGISRGAFYVGNDRDGIGIYDSVDATIGRVCGLISGCAGRGNIISGNDRHGVFAQGDVPRIRIAGNRIGTDRFGNSTNPAFSPATGNGDDGVHLEPGGGGPIFGLEIGSLGSIIDLIGGGLIPVSAGNLISGNDDDGIHLQGDYTANVVANRIGTNAAGTSALPNGGNGIYTLGGGGGSSFGADGLGGNLISGNTENGYYCDGGSPGPILNNRIGTNANMDGVIPNGLHGIEIECEASMRRNVIGGNTLSGIWDHRVAVIHENWIGTNSAGADLGNGQHGIHYDANGFGSRIGRAGQGNRIGFNALDGIHLTGNTVDIEGNYIGTDEFNRDLGNGRHGVYYQDGANVDLGNVDGLTNGDGNIIGFNAQHGVRMNQLSSGNGASIQIWGNYIGTNANGDDLGNGFSGIYTLHSNDYIGAPLEFPAGPIADSEVARYGNVIAHNTFDGIRKPSGSAAPIRGNLFFANGQEAIDLGPSGPTPNDFGDTDLGANRQQNTPAFDSNLTSYDEGTGDVLVRYRVDSNLGDAAYPITVDFYVRDPWLEPGDQARVFIGSDSYPAASASAFRSVAIAPLPGTVAPNPLGFVFESLVATATDANGNTSEFSVQPVVVPEPSSVAMLAAGILGLLGVGSQRRGRRPSLTEESLSA